MYMQNNILIIKQDHFPDSWEYFYFGHEKLSKKNLLKWATVRFEQPYKQLVKSCIVNGYFEWIVAENAINTNEITIF